MLVFHFRNACAESEECLYGSRTLLVRYTNNACVPRKHGFLVEGTLVPAPFSVVSILFQL